MSRKLDAVGKEAVEDVRLEFLVAGDSVEGSESLEREVSLRTMGDDCISSDCSCGWLASLFRDAATTRTVDRSGDASSNVCNASAGPALDPSSASTLCRNSCS